MTSSVATIAIRLLLAAVVLATRLLSLFRREPGPRARLLPELDQEVGGDVVYLRPRGALPLRDSRRT